MTLAQHEPVRIVTGEPGAPAVRPDPTALINGAAAALVLVLLVTLARARRRRIAADPLGHAFARLSRALRLSRGERRTLAGVADRFGAPPAALLLSREAMIEACARAENDGEGGAAGLRARLGC